MQNPTSDALFHPTDEHKMLRQTVADFVRKEVEPQAAAHDELGELNVALFRKLGELGLLGITIPEEDGGAGMESSRCTDASAARSSVSCPLERESRTPSRRPSDASRMRSTTTPCRCSRRAARG